MQKNLGEIMGNYNEKSRFCSIDTDHNPDSAAEFQIRSIPSTLFFKHGKLVSEIVGSVPQTVVISQIVKHTS
jgi:thioredoxin 1